MNVGTVRKFAADAKAGNTRALASWLDGLSNDDRAQAMRLPADVGEDDERGATLLHLAAEEEQPAMVNLLLQRGADANALDDRRDTPYALVATKQSERAAEVRAALLEHGAFEDYTFFHDGHVDAIRDDEGDASYIDGLLLRKVFATFLIPFIGLMLYNGIFFSMVFVLLTTVFYFVAVGSFVSAITVRPPWYQATPGSTKLSTSRLPENWKNMVIDPRKHFGYNFSNVEFRSHGKTLRGWLVPGSRANRRTKTCLVFAHGGGRDRRSWLRHLPTFRDRGYTSLLFDMREHGTSDGAHRGLSFGMYERFDVLEAARFMKEKQGFEKVVVLGTSMGASAAIMAAPLDKTSIDGVVAENPLMTCAHLQSQHIKELMDPYFQHSFWGRLVLRSFQRVSSVWLNIRVGNKPSRRCQSTHVIHKIAPRPLLLMHGTADRVVPVEHSQKLFEMAREPKRLWIAPGAFHTALFDSFPKEFGEHVFSFLRVNGFDS